MAQIAYKIEIRKPAIKVASELLKKIYHDDNDADAMESMGAMAQKKDKILPIKVWLDEESCWNNEPKYSEGYVGYVREDYHAQAMLHVLHKGVKQGKKEMLDKMREWLNKNLLTSDITVEHYIVFENFIKCFEEAMDDAK